METRNTRRSPRHKVDNVRGKFHLASPGRILNMSLTGMAVETDAALRVGRTYSITIRHAEDPELELSGKVVWSKLQGGRREDGSAAAVYVSGVAFDGVLDGAAASLVKFLERSAVLDVRTRVCGRFAIVSGSTADLATVYPFEVRTLSAHGLLLECGCSVALNQVLDASLELDGQTARVRARVAFTRVLSATADGERAELGVEFVEARPEDMAAIQHYIAALLTP